MGYFEEKVKKAYVLSQQGLPFKKVYTVIEKDGLYVVLRNGENSKYKYSLSGGGVEDNEDNVSAVKREVLEEMGIDIEVERSLGTISYSTVWKYEEKPFEVKFEAEIYLSKYVSKINDNFGLEGEFGKGISGVALITKEEMLKTVAEFVSFNVKLD